MHTRDNRWDETRRYLVALSHVKGLGAKRTSRLISVFGDAASAWSAPRQALLSALGPKTTDSLVETRRRLDLDGVMARIDDGGVAVVTKLDGAYPGTLKEISSPPWVLYVLGDASLLHTRSVAIVGTRKASGYGRRAARIIAGGLSAKGITIVSGMALGVDGEAHLAALDNGGATVAVLGSGLDEPYPPGHVRLMDHIVESGAVISEYPLGTKPLPGQFPTRNRIVSGLSIAVVVVEAGHKSGALITAKLAAQQGREVLAVPGGITSGLSVGTNQLIFDGATMARSADDVVGAMELTGLTHTVPVNVPLPSDPVQAALVERLRLAPMHIDDLIRETRIDGAEVARALSVLEVIGMVEHLGNMQWAVYS